MTRIVMADEAGIADAVRFLQQGACVALPTETVYGLAADARSPVAIATIYEAKGRPAHNPLIVHVATLEEAEKLIVLDGRARDLAARFWPGPLTIVAPLQSAHGLAPEASAGLRTLGVRVPAHPLFQAVLQRCGFPLAAPSANASGTLSATTPQIVAAGLSGKIPLILAAGNTDKGLESTIVDLSHPDAVFLLRHGAVPRENIETIVGPVLDASQPTGVPKSPGQLLRHYAPRARLRLNAVDVQDGEALLAFGDLKFMGLVSGGWAKDLSTARLRNLSPSGDLDEAAKYLFAYLYALDQAGATHIAVMSIPDNGVGVAINDRLRRACHAQETA